MNFSIYVHPRVHEKHPELTDEDVQYAWENAAMSGVRYWPDPPEYIAVGFDRSGRAIEMIAVRNAEYGWFIYHAFTPPTKKFIDELNFGKGLL